MSKNFKEITYDDYIREMEEDYKKMSYEYMKSCQIQFENDQVQEQKNKERHERKMIEIAFIKEHEEKLIGCPLCNNRPSLRTDSGNEGHHPDSIHITCKNCNLELQVDCDLYQKPETRTEGIGRATKIWNKRKRK